MAKPRCKVEYRDGEWVIFYGNKKIARITIDLRLYDMVDMDPYELDSHIHVECMEG